MINEKRDIPQRFLNTRLQGQLNEPDVAGDIIAGSKESEAFRV